MAAEAQPLAADAADRASFTLEVLVAGLAVAHREAAAEDLADLVAEALAAAAQEAGGNKNLNE